jgi:hypothetical protein
LIAKIRLFYFAYLCPHHQKYMYFIGGLLEKRKENRGERRGAREGKRG